MTTKAPYRAEHVGSFLRPRKLLNGRAKFEKGKVLSDELHRIEDECIRDLVTFEESIGFQPITDGEYRRHSFHMDFLSKLDGVKLMSPAERSTFLGPSSVSNEVTSVGSGLPTPRIIGRLGRGKGIFVEAFKFLKSVTTRTAKVTMPSPSMLHFRGGRDAIDKTVYPTMEEFYDDLIHVWRDEIMDLSALGCTYVQLDDTNLAFLCDPRYHQRIESRGERPEEVTHLYARLISEAFRDRPASMTAAIHLCRGNAQSSSMAAGGYEPVADIMLNETAVDGFFLEYDDDRSGGFEPLRFLPKGKRAVLGLITTKHGQLEKIDDVLARI